MMGHNIEEHCIIFPTNCRRRQRRVAAAPDHDGKRDRLHAIGLTASDGTQVEVHHDSLIINGVEFDINVERIIKFSDVEVQVVTHLKSRHRGTVFYLKEGPVFHVAVKEVEK